MQLTMTLDETSVKPIVSLDWFTGCRALIDTGADIPVWISDIDILESLGGRPDEKYKTVGINGFGGQNEAPLYRVDFQMKDIIYPNMPIACVKLKGINAQIILSANNFKKMIYEIDTVNNKVNINIPDNQPSRPLAIREENGKLSIYLQDVKEN